MEDAAREVLDSDGAAIHIGDTVKVDRDAVPEHVEKLPWAGRRQAKVTATDWEDGTAFVSVHYEDDTPQRLDAELVTRLPWPEVWIVYLDETGDWGEEIIKRTGRILTVYVYNKHEVTYACEITPSYWLVPVGFVVQHDVPDEGGCEGTLEDDLRRALSDMEGMYMHCSDIDGLPAVSGTEQVPFFLTDEQPSENFRGCQFVLFSEEDTEKLDPEADVLEVARDIAQGHGYTTI